jgi:hypothetical protein
MGRGFTFQSGETAHRKCTKRQKPKELQLTDDSDKIYVDGIQTATSSFVHAAFVALLDHFSYGDLKLRLRVIDSHDQDSFGAIGTRGSVILLLKVRGQHPSRPRSAS